MLWEEVLDDSQYEATHYLYLEICGDMPSTKNYYDVVNEFSLPFVDFRKPVGRNSNPSYIYSPCLFLLIIHRKM